MCMQYVVSVRSIVKLTQFLMFIKHLSSKNVAQAHIVLIAVKYGQGIYFFYVPITRGTK